MKNSIFAVDKEQGDKMKVIVDNKIPYIKGVIEGLADEVAYLPGKDFTPEAVKGADALIIRTRTHCDRDLLQGSRVRFIGTATIGFDHIDTAYCREAGITWCNCPGCNAGAVEQYVRSSLLLLQKERGIDLNKACLGIVGVGHVGSHVLSLAARLGMRVLLNDPPRASRGERGFVDLDTIMRECDIITFHTPLVRTDPYPTFHLADQAFFHSLRKKPCIINTSRGEVIDTRAILSALDEGLISAAILDVWENEPNIDLELLQKVFIGTPHIAGYSADGKANATRMVLESFCRFFHIAPHFSITLPPRPLYNKECAPGLDYNPQADCEKLREHPGLFEQIRGDYPLRRE